MVQWILTLLIVAASLGFAGYLIRKKFFGPKPKAPEDCSGCSSECAGCSLAEIKNASKSSK